MANAKTRKTELIGVAQQHDQGCGTGAGTSEGLQAVFQRIRPDQEQDHERAASSSSRGSLRVLFNRMASFSQDSQGSEEEMPKQPITSSLVREVSSKMQLASMKATEGARKRRYNNNRRTLLKNSKVPARRNLQKSRADAARLNLLVSGICGCSWETCFSQFKTILTELIALLTIFAQAAKVIRDEVLRCSVGEQDVGVLGFRLSIKCFCKLFQISKTVVSTLAQGKLHLDRRFKGAVRQPLPSVQERRIRIYLSTVYCRDLSSSVHISIQSCFMFFAFNVQSYFLF